MTTIKILSLCGIYYDHESRGYLATREAASTPGCEAAFEGQFFYYNTYTLVTGQKQQRITNVVSFITNGQEHWHYEIMIKGTSRVGILRRRCMLEELTESAVARAISQFVDNDDCDEEVMTTVMKKYGISNS